MKIACIVAALAFAVIALQGSVVAEEKIMLPQTSAPTPAQTTPTPTTAATSPSVTGPGFFHLAYVELKSSNLSNAGCYMMAEEGGKPLFDMVSLFAGNVDGDGLFLNERVKHVLDETSQVAELQNKGIKVIFTVLGNYAKGGWECFDPSTTDGRAKIGNFANDLVSLLVKYNLDGVDIDDEYGTCTQHPDSMIQVAKAIKADPRFHGKTMSKALFDDSTYFNSGELATLLDYGWEISYGSGGPDGRLQKYVDYGMAKK